MKEPSKAKQALSPSDRTKILVVIVFLVILLVLLGLLLGVLLRQGGFQFSLPSSKGGARRPPSRLGLSRRWSSQRSTVGLPPWRSGRPRSRSSQSAPPRTDP